METMAVEVVVVIVLKNTVATINVLMVNVIVNDNALMENVEMMVAEDNVVVRKIVLDVVKMVIVVNIAIRPMGVIVR